jgi:3-dehydroquinate synthase
MQIPVRLGARSYAIVVEPGSLAKLGDHLRPLGLGSKAALVSDAGIRARYGAAVVESLRTAGFAVVEIDVPAGESAKTLAVASACWDALVEARLDRSSTVIALGGGAVGDVAGFVAATYMRGMNFVQVPTTVLAQVDASVGGKTAIDHPRGKNMIGSFHQPRLVLVDPLTVLSLPERDFRSGLAEIIKHGIVLDAGYFADLERSIAAMLGRDPGTLERLIGGSCALKASVIERDPEEKAEIRYTLNYGHTIGHAIEAVTGYARFTHGEAVALGIVAEAHLARRIGLAGDATVVRQESLLRAVGLPTRATGLEPGRVLDAMARDKKARDGRVPIVLAPEIGAYRVVYDVGPGAIRGALAVLEAA